MLLGITGGDLSESLHPACDSAAQMWVAMPSSMPSPSFFSSGGCRSPVGWVSHLPVSRGYIKYPTMSQRALTMFQEWIRALISGQLNYFLAPTDCVE